MAGRTVTATLALNAQNYIAGMNRAAAATRDFATKANAAVGKNKVSIERLGKASGLIGAGLAVGVVAAVKSAADFDSAMSSVAATGADAKNNLVALRQAAIQAGADTKFSATEAAGGLESLAKAGVSSKDALGGGLKGALDLAAAGNLNVSDSAEVAATAMTQFGLAGSQVPHIADLLAAGAGKAQGEVSDMAQALNQSGLVAAQFGLSIEDTTGTLAAFANAGLVGSDAGTSFKTMLQRLANPSAQASDAMKKLGINAYDAQGNFVGITSLADQLKNKLGPLTQAQRNAALATIFGSDAIRSASILYEQGASGIQTWIDNVNQTGYASDVAATKMDNLKGDLEQLRGSFETALIGLGEGANGPLRSLVQSITDAVNSFNTLDDGTKSAVLAVGGIGAGALLGVAGVAKLAVGTSEAIGAFRSLAASAPRLASALRTVGAAGLVAVAGLAALRGIGAINNDIKGKFTPDIELASAALVNLGTTGRNLDINHLFQYDASGNQGFTKMAHDVDGLQSAFRLLKAPTALEKVREQIDPIIGTTGGLTTVKAQFAEVDAELSKLSANGQGGVAAKSFAQIAQTAAAAGVGVDQLKTIFPQYAQSVRDVESASGGTITSTQQLVDLMSGKLPAGASSSSGALNAASTALAAIGSSSASAASDLDALTSSLFATANAALATSDAQIGFQQAVDAAAESAKKNGDNLKLSTEAGRENQSALNNLAAAGQKYVQSLIDQGASSKDVVSATRDARRAFIENAEAMGVSAPKAKALADQYGLIPKRVSTTVDAKVDTAKAELAKVNAAIKGLPKDQQVQVRSAYKSGGIEAAQAKLKELKDKTVTAGTKANTQGAVKAKQAMDQLDSRTVTAGTKADTSGATKTQRAVNGVKGKSVTVSVNANTSGATEARNAIATVHGKTVNVVINRVAKGDADGGPILTTLPHFDAGGRVRGSGGPRDDNVMGIDRATGLQTSWVSVGEFVTNAASYAANRAGIEAINAGKGRPFKVTPLADGGLAAATGRYQSSDIYALIQALIAPVQDIASAAADVQREQAKIGKPLAAKNKAEKAYDKAKDRQEDLRDRVARLAKEAAATKGQTKADRDLAKARRALTAANNDVSKSSRAKTKAEQAYKDVAGPLEEATQRLTDAQKALADSARGVSDSFSQQYRSSSTDAQDWIDLMTTGATDLKTFNAEIVQLRKTGLSETLVQQIVAMGQVAGGEIANQIIAGGSSLAAALNTANANLQSAADDLGYTSSLAPVRKFASGTPSAPSGLAWVGEQGPELVSFRGGESVLNAAASRAVVTNNYVRTAYAANNARAANIDPNIVRAALAGMRIQGQLDVSQDRGYLDGVVVEVLGRETSKLGTAF